MKISLKMGKLDWESCKNRLGFLRFGKMKTIFYILVIGVTSYAMYFWYDYINHSEWTADQKKKYLDQREKDTVFDKNKFKKVIDTIDKRKENLNQKITGIPDIFRLK